jgi:Fic family protein
MDADAFRNSPSGRLIPTIENCFAFLPNPLPPQGLDLAPFAPLLERASRALGELGGLGRTLPNPALLINPFARAEAIASSRIEGTVTSPHELLMLELTAGEGNARSDTREVDNYNRALRHGLKRVAELPVSKRLLNELHAILLDGVATDRGARIMPGEFKRTQNWIGGRTIRNARFVPPPPAESEAALDDLEKFINRERESLPLLVKLAMVHYQFEAIHPYPDGNGRVGRLLIPLVLCQQKAISQPLFYLSPYFERRYDQYIDLMLEISRTGAWSAWISFFLTGAETVSLGAIKKVTRLQDLRQEYMARVGRARSSGLLPTLVDALFTIPAITVPKAASGLGISYNAAKNNLGKLAELGIIEAERFRDDNTTWYFAYEIMAIAEQDD